MSTVTDLEKRFNEVCFTLSAADIYAFDSRDNGPINNVISKINRHCFGTELIDDEIGLASRMYYVNNDEGLKGDIICLNLDDPDYKALLLRFGVLLSIHYPGVDAINSFNIFQTQLRTFLEKRGFFTTTSTELDEFKGEHLSMAAFGKRGIKNVELINRVKYYREFFCNNYATSILTDSQYLYLMLNDDTSLIKIGTSKHPKYREGTLHSKEPGVYLIALWKVDKTVEKALHKQYRDKRTRGEWFRLTIPDLHQIEVFMEKTGE